MSVCQRPGRVTRAVFLLVGALTAVAVAAGAPATAAEGTTGPKPPPVLAKSWIVVDLSDGHILAAKDPHRRLRPASTLKTLTAVTLLPRLDLKQRYRVQWADAAVEGSAVGIVPGATYTVDQLFYGLFLPSGNDAAHALANAAGGVHRTVTLMQQTARQLGADDTTVRNPSGLDARGQFTSAYDLALFARAGMRLPDFRRYVSTVTTAFPGGMPKRPGQQRQTYQIYNQNPLLLAGYRGVLGIKTGYTTLAGRTFVGAAQRGGHLLVAVIMDTVEPTEDAARTLLDWGFAHVDAHPVGYLVGASNPTERKVHLSAAAPLASTDSTTTAGPTVGLAWPQLLALAVVAVGLVFVAASGTALVRRYGSSGSDPEDMRVE